VGGGVQSRRFTAKKIVIKKVVAARSSAQVSLACQVRLRINSPCKRQTLLKKKNKLV
jgi:hypothetical protein